MPRLRRRRRRDLTGDDGRRSCGRGGGGGLAASAQLARGSALLLIKEVVAAATVCLGDGIEVLVSRGAQIAAGRRKTHVRARFVRMYQPHRCPFRNETCRTAARLNHRWRIGRRRCRLGNRCHRLNISVCDAKGAKSSKRCARRVLCNFC